MPRNETPRWKRRDPVDQAHSDADTINAFAAIIRSTFTEENMQDVSPAAKQRLIQLLEQAINTIKKAM